jgi:hypothetical protein
VEQRIRWSSFYIGAKFPFPLDILVCKDPVTVQLLEVGGEIREKYKAQAAVCTASSCSKR